MFFKVAAGLAVLLAVFIYRSGRVVWHGILTTPDLPDAHFAGGNWTSHCAIVHDPLSTDLAYCEDITFWDHHDARGALADRLVLLGCDPNRKAWNTVMGPLRDPAPRGHLFLYDPRARAVRRVALEGYPATHDFHPLGMEIYPSRDGSPSNLFVVNHARAETTIELFVLDPKKTTTARYVRTLRSPYFVSPNAIALTGPTSFYVSNDHLITRRLPGLVGRVLPLVETIAGLPFGWVAHVDVGDADSALSHTFAALGISFANGVALSPSRAELAVASTSLGLVHVYTLPATVTANANVDTDADHVSLTPLIFSHTIPIPFFPDNLAYDDDGALVITGHPHFPSLVGVAANKTGATALSWAVAVRPPVPSGSVPRSAPMVETLFQSNGSVFGSSSTTLRDARTGEIYVSGLYERGMLICHP